MLNEFKKGRNVQCFISCRFLFPRKTQEIAPITLLLKYSSTFSDGVY